MKKTTQLNATQLNVYIVAGIQDSGKTTVIRGITKRKRGGFTQITGVNGNIMDFYFRTQSLQEKRISPQGFQNIVKNELQKKKFSSVLIALRTDYVSYNKLAEDYINYFINTCNWNVVFVAELKNGQHLQQYTTQYKYKYQSFLWQNIVNQLVNYVKNFFNFK